MGNRDRFLAKIYFLTKNGATVHQ